VNPPDIDIAGDTTPTKRSNDDSTTPSTIAAKARNTTGVDGTSTLNTPNLHFSYYHIRPHPQTIQQQRATLHASTNITHANLHPHTADTDTDTIPTIFSNPRQDKSGDSR
jgi:hypothetical protein